MHSIAHHGMDVAACASVLLDTFRAPVGVPSEALAALIALHDIGKFTRTFQGKVEPLWPPSLGPYEKPVAGYPHDDCGFALLAGELAEQLDPLFANWRSASARDPLLRAITGHHGRPPHDNRDLPRKVAGPVCIAAASTFIDAALNAIDPPPLPLLAANDRHHLAWFLAGLVVLADWLGSGRGWFTPVIAAEHANLGRYWHEIALPRARRAVKEAGVLPSPVSLATGIATLFPEIGDPRPVQEWAECVVLPEGPALFTIEDATGSGKTEAALVLAHRLMAAGRAEGLFCALPTMATADAMYARLERAYLRLFAPDARPSLVLAHSRRSLNARFTESILQAAADPSEDTAEPADQPAGAQCAGWIADDRRKAFLAEIGVGTLDQALIGVLPTRHAPLRLLGLSRRVLVIDEAHAYDTYMTEELKRLLSFHAALGGSAIVLSATLSARQRAELAAAFLSGLGCTAEPDGATAYPLVTVVSAAGITAEPRPMAPEMRRSVAVERIADEAAAIQAIAEAARQGAAVAWVRNAVDDAIGAHAALQGLGLDPLLFHARFAMGDRLGIEHKVLARFGRTSSADQRRGVLVATQVVEQSLDLDFDLMVTDLAPADLLIQRAGRLWRHARGARPVRGPRVLLLAPEPIDDPPEDWLGPELRRTGAVYVDHALLWRSARVFLHAGAIATPDGIRALIEVAYDQDAPGAEPPALGRATRRAEAERLTARGIAWQNLLQIDKPYRRDAGVWEPDVRTPTRLGDPQLVFRLARIEDGRVVPWFPDAIPNRAWALSEVSVRAARLSGAAPDAATQPLVTAAKEAWRVWDRAIPVLVLRPDNEDTWRGMGMDRDGESQAVTYKSIRGLIIGEVPIAG